MVTRLGQSQEIVSDQALDNSPNSDHVDQSCSEGDAVLGRLKKASEGHHLGAGLATWVSGTWGLWTLALSDENPSRFHYWRQYLNPYSGHGAIVAHDNPSRSFVI